MKLENTSETKSRFFALYWRQKVMRTDQTKKILCDPLAIGHGDWYLELTPLSQITDEDADELSKVGLPDRLYDYLWGAPIGKAIAKSIEAGRQTNTFYPNFRMADAFDFLRSRGYYVGDGTEVTFGWAKLKGEDTCKP